VSDAFTSVPPVDVQVIAAGFDERQLVDVGAEKLERPIRRRVAGGSGEGLSEVGQRGIVANTHGRAGDPRVAIGDLFVDRRAVQREATVSQQVAGLERARHHAQPELAQGEQWLDTADPWRTVASKRGQQRQAMGLETLFDRGAKLGCSEHNFRPGRHAHQFRALAHRDTGYSWSEMATALAMAAAAFLVTLSLGYPALAYLRRAGAAKQVRSDELESHFGKTGTLTMGGVLFVGPIVVLTLVLALTWLGESGRSILLPTVTMLVTAALGAYDDRLSLVGSRGGGLSARAKFVLLGGAAFVAAIALWHPAMLGIDYVFVPGIVQKISIGWLIVPLAWLSIVGAAHAVNLTDGLDGLAGHTAAVAFAAYGAIAFLQGQVYLVTFCFTVAGALLAFLWFNAYPAQLIMGDTGALALGATLAVVALMLGQVLLLPIIGFIYVAVTVSVILQVGYFRLSSGKRLLRRAPLHRHFELMGWSQMQVAQRFWLISMITGLLGVALAIN
jgi:phospho-N-acetylmuramoyl-pentapeptide-transferase